jgi:hypothetical protein
MTPQSAVAGEARKRWRRLCLGVALLGVLVLAASALPWFTETRVFASGGSDTDPVNIWTEGPAVSARSRAGGLAQLAGSGQWAMLVIVAAAVGAICGLFARGQHPGDVRLRAALRLNAIGALLAPVFAVFALIAANSGERVSAVPNIGFLLTVPALLAWLVCAVLMWRAASAANAAGQHAW